MRAVTVPRVGYRLIQPQAPVPEVRDSPKPVLAVLPFANLSGDPEQDYFADGVVEDIITALSKFKSFAVIARNSSFTYKGRAVDVRQVAQELGVNYVVEGSVRRGGGKLRISAQLVDGATGVHVWAQSFDGPIEEVFDVQDRVTENVAALVAPRIQRAEIERARRERPGSLAAYDLYLQALPDLHSSLPAGNARAINLLERAIELDPGFAPALAAASEACLLKVAMQFPGAAEADAERAVELAQAALAVAGDDAMVLGYCGFVLIHMGSDYETGIAVLQRAIEENPNNATVLTCAGVGNLLGGDLGLAADYLQRALQLNPNSFETQWQLTGMAHIRMAEGRYAEALDWATRSQAVNSVYDANHWMLIAGNAHLGRLQEAHKYLAALEVLSPGVSLARIRRAGERLRISAQLVECANGQHIWAEQFDGKIGDVFDFQDRITESVATVVEPHIQKAELERSHRERPGSIAAYDLYLRALPKLSMETAADNAEASSLLLASLALEPDNPVFLAFASYAFGQRLTRTFATVQPEERRKSAELARRGLELAAGNATVIAHCSMILMHNSKDYELAMAAIRSALEANPNDLLVVGRAGVAHLHCGTISDALRCFHRTIRLGPRDPETHMALTGIAHAQLVLGDYEEAMVWAVRSLALNPNYHCTYWMLIAANAQLGRMDEARKFLSEFRKLAPMATVASIWAGQPQMDPSRCAAILQGLRLAGLPE